MPWTHRRILYEKPGANVFLIHYAGQADATDLTDYILFDIGVDAPAKFTKTQINSLTIQSGGVLAILEWDATTDDFIAACPDGQKYHFPPPFDQEDLVAGKMLIDPASTGTTGDIVLTTLGGAVGDGVIIDAEIKVL